MSDWVGWIFLAGGIVGYVIGLKDGRKDETRKWVEHLFQQQDIAGKQIAQDMQRVALLHNSDDT